MSKSRPSRITRRRLLGSTAAGALIAATTRDITVPAGSFGLARSKSEVANSPGHIQLPVQFMAAGGWLGTANGVLKFLSALRGNAALPQQYTTMMTSGGLGIFPGTSPFGPYYFKSGTQNYYAPGTRNVVAAGKTGIVQFPDGYDAVLFLNSNGTPIADLAVAFGASPPPSMYPD